jgi:hypothetical protein
MEQKVKSQEFSQHLWHHLDLTKLRQRYEGIFQNLAKIMCWAADTIL